MKYPVFIQALALTIIVFVVGLYSGIALENSRFATINDYQIQSETALMDIMNLNNLVGVTNVSCTELKQANFDMLNKIYSDASVLNEYEKSQRMGQGLNDLHKKYDILRAYLWVDSIKIKERCGDNFNTLVYLYNNSEKDINLKAEQNVWSKVLYDVKSANPNDTLLIPISIDSDLSSLKPLLNSLNITKYPSVVVNEEHVFSGKIPSKEDIVKYFNKTN